MSRIRPARFVHVVYRTRRFEQMVKWYETVFDAKVRYQNPVLAFLSYDDEHHRIALINMACCIPATAGAAVIGVDHVAYTYDSVGDLFENYAQLKERASVPIGASITA
jgi:catechol-2,3-dioxygenase